MSGWIKRGPNGVVGSNIFDAQETADTIISHWDKIVDDESNESKNGDILQYFNDREVAYVDWEGWLAIKKQEELNGEKLGKISEKFVDINQMVKVARGGE